ncbi:hypothetical protein D3C73_1186680 [compost metagenome]
MLKIIHQIVVLFSRCNGNRRRIDCILAVPHPLHMHYRRDGIRGISILEVCKSVRLTPRLRRYQSANRELSLCRYRISAERIFDHWQLLAEDKRSEDHIRQPGRTGCACRRNQRRRPADEHRNRQRLSLQLRFLIIEPCSAVLRPMNSGSAVVINPDPVHTEIMLCRLG